MEYELNNYAEESLDYVLRDPSLQWPSHAKYCKSCTIPYTNGWLLHQDNALPQVSKAMMKFINRKDMKLLEHTPYSPDLAPYDFFLFPKLKSKLGSQWYNTDNALIQAVQGCVRVMSKDSFLHIFELWQQKLDKCIEVHGDYVEKKYSIIFLHDWTLASMTFILGFAWMCLVIG